ncbi:MAG: hypothetical protein NZZ41_04275 [Candidatus Dojkabacteria bacterium]|nr:hypothetical protein [Candidatus Dojkabacteria bacterium]
MRQKKYVTADVVRDIKLWLEKRKKINELKKRILDLRSQSDFLMYTRANFEVRKIKEKINELRSEYPAKFQDICNKYGISHTLAQWIKSYYIIGKRSCYEGDDYEYEYVIEEEEVEVDDSNK